MADNELKLIEGLLSLIDSMRQAGDLSPTDIARAVEYVAERVYARRDDYQREVEAERVDEAKSEAREAMEIMRDLSAKAAAAAGCECEQCQRLRTGHQRFDA